MAAKWWAPLKLACRHWLPLNVQSALKPARWPPESDARPQVSSCAIAPSRLAVGERPFQTRLQLNATLANPIDWDAQLEEAA